MQSFVKTDQLRGLLSIKNFNSNKLSIKNNPIKNGYRIKQRVLRIKHKWLRNKEMFNILGHHGNKNKTKNF